MTTKLAKGSKVIFKAFDDGENVFSQIENCRPSAAVCAIECVVENLLIAAHESDIDFDTISQHIQRAVENGIKGAKEFIEKESEKGNEQDQFY